MCEQWSAQVWDEAGVRGGVSAPATFGTALEADGAHPTAWQATPIWPAGEQPSYAFFRAKFGLPTTGKQLYKAVAYVTATADLMETGTWNSSHLVDHRISGYSLYVNGHWVAQGPGRSERHTEQVYDAIDITEHLLPIMEEQGTSAEHTIASHGQSGSLGGAAAFGPVSPKCQDSWCLHGGQPATEEQLGLPQPEHRGFMLQVLGWFDGSAEPQLLLATGSNGSEWLARDGDSAYASSPPCGISYNCMYPFEYIDARHFPIGWNKPEFETTGAGGWAAPVARAGFQRSLQAKYTAAVQPVLYKGDAKGQQLDRGQHPPVAVTQAVAHVNLNASSPSWAKYDANATGREVTVYDFGTQMDAGIRLQITCSNTSNSGDCAGKQVVLEYGDVLFPDGSVRWGTQGATHDREIWTLRKGVNDLQHLEYRTWRYAQVARDDPALSNGLVLTAMRVGYPFDPTKSSVATADPLVDEIFAYCKHTIETLYMDTTTDSNERERMPYAGDGYFAHETRYSVGGDYTMARHSMEVMFDNPSWCAPWIYMQVWHGWLDYMQTGSLRMLTDHYNTHYENALGLQFLSPPRMVPSNGLYARDPNPPGTWPPEQLGNPYMDNYGSDGYSPGSNIDMWSNVVPAKTMAVMALIAGAVGDTSNATFFRKSADALRTSINTYMFDTVKGCYRDGLLTATNHTAIHSIVFPLDFGITPPSHRATCVQSMLDKFNASGGLLSAGYGAWRSYIRGLYGSAAEAPAAPQKALEFLTQKTGSVGKKGYGYWHQLRNLNATTTPEQWDPPEYGGTCTWSHLWGTVPGHVIPQSLFGVTATAPAHATIQIRPLAGNLSYGKARVPTIRGAVVVEFNQTGGFDSPPSGVGGGSGLSHSPAVFWLRVVIPPNVQAAVLLPALDAERKTYHYQEAEAAEAEVVAGLRAVQVGGAGGLVGSGEHVFVLHSRWGLTGE